jgi:fructose-1,6-bisphosphatase/inositol monophosphatase family enzyme
MRIVPITEKELITCCVPLVQTVVNYANIQWAKNIGFHIMHPSDKDINNITREVDGWTHTLYETVFAQFGNRMVITGEEGKKIKQTKVKRTVGSIDAIDGTDLWAKGFYNWCTALFFFIPGEKIVSSFVGVPSSPPVTILSPALTGGRIVSGVPAGTVYYTYLGEAFKRGKIEGIPKRKKLKIPDENKNRTIKEASICFYGQKPKNILNLLENERFVNFLKILREESAEKKAVPFRIYNLGGNPMMVKLAEGFVDAVIELVGQDLYDVLPGAFIAQKAGAFFGDLRGNRIDDDYLKKLLSEPGTPTISYLLTASESLYRELLEYFKQ